MKRSSKILQVFKKPVRTKMRLYATEFNVLRSLFTSEKRAATLICGSKLMAACAKNIARKAINRKALTLSKLDFLISLFTLYAMNKWLKRWFFLRLTYWLLVVEQIWIFIVLLLAICVILERPTYKNVSNHKNTEWEFINISLTSLVFVLLSLL